MNQSLIKEIKALGFPKKKIETELGMPLNSLSAMMNGKRNTPDKWEIKLQQYVTLNALPKTKQPENEVPDQPKDKDKKQPPPPKQGGKPLTEAEKRRIELQKQLDEL